VQCRILGLDYVGVGTSTNRKDAHTEAAKNMLEYLVYAGCINANEVPEFEPVRITYASSVDCLENVI